MPVSMLSTHFELDDPHSYVLVEVYRTPESADRHKQTPTTQHGAMRWLPGLAEPRSNVKYENLFPADGGW